MYKHQYLITYTPARREPTLLNNLTQNKFERNATRHSFPQMRLKFWVLFLYVLSQIVLPVVSFLTHRATMARRIASTSLRGTDGRGLMPRVICGRAECPSAPLAAIWTSFPGRRTTWCITGI